MMALRLRMSCLSMGDRCRSVGGGPCCIIMPPSAVLATAEYSAAVPRAWPLVPCSAQVEHLGGMTRWEVGCMKWFLGQNCSS